MNQALCSNLSIEQGKKLFKEMLDNTKDYLKSYPNLDDFINID